MATENSNTEVSQKQITIDILDRTGHTTRVVIYDDAIEIIKEEMGNGKWLNVVGREGKEGNDEVVTSFEDLLADVQATQALLSGAQKLELIAALTGGQG